MLDSRSPQLQIANSYGKTSWVHHTHICRLVHRPGHLIYVNLPPPPQTLQAMPDSAPHPSFDNHPCVCLAKWLVFTYKRFTMMSLRALLNAIQICQKQRTLQSTFPNTGIPDNALAKIITKNPLIFNVSIDDLQVVIDYFKSKNFSEADIPQIVIRAPRLFLMPVSRIDGKLGFYQKFFQLSGSQVRETISRLPKLITYDVKAIKDIHFQMKEFLGFTNSDLQKIFLTSPRVFLSNKYILTKVFDYLHNEMGLSHAQLMLWPNIFRTRLYRIKERHEFLKHLKRHQYDLDKENFVSLKTLVSDDDKTFCLNVAKSSTAEYNQFLKTL
ncbi:MTERFD [Acanthosepion pharaonis]|uniref:mTERFD n=1 Tax=Acanthosepion pharaonis TaxID=158019 RepID=A0A812D4H5_ACAPH|nr:MTERFD [Sepia pharaonis]